MKHNIFVFWAISVSIRKSNIFVVQHRRLNNKLLVKCQGLPANQNQIKNYMFTCGNFVVIALHYSDGQFESHMKTKYTFTVSIGVKRVINSTVLLIKSTWSNHHWPPLWKHKFWQFLHDAIFSKNQTPHIKTDTNNSKQSSKFVTIVAKKEKNKGATMVQSKSRLQFNGNAVAGP